MGYLASKIWDPTKPSCRPRCRAPQSPCDIRTLASRMRAIAGINDMRHLCGRARRTCALRRPPRGITGALCATMQHHNDRCKRRHVLRKPTNLEQNRKSENIDFPLHFPVSVAYPCFRCTWPRFDILSVFVCLLFFVEGPIMGIF